MSISICYNKHILPKEGIIIGNEREKPIDGKGRASKRTPTDLMQVWLFKEHPDRSMGLFKNFREEIRATIHCVEIRANGILVYEKAATSAGPPIGKSLPRHLYPADINEGLLSQAFGEKAAAEIIAARAMNRRELFNVIEKKT